MLESPIIDNNKRKFAFLSTETVPDYRPKEQRIQKSQKTSSNQTTKFQQLQQKFELNNRDIPFLKEINGIEDDILTENDVSSHKLAHKSLLTDNTFFLSNPIVSDGKILVSVEYPGSVYNLVLLSGGTCP